MPATPSRLHHPPLVLMLFAFPALLAASSTSASGTSPTSPPSRDLLTADRYLEWEQVAEPQVAPDGRRVIYTRRWVDVMRDEWAASLWIVRADGSENRFLTHGSSPRWSPDGKRVAYLAEDDAKQTQIFVRFVDTPGTPSQITRVTRKPANLRWSPDGRWIAFTMIVPRQNTWKVKLPDPPAGAKWTDPPRVVEDRTYRYDRRSFLEDGHNHLFIVPADGGSAIPLTEGAWNVGGRPYGLPESVGLDWTPDGEEIVFDGLKADDADLRYRESHLYAVNVKTRALRQITERKGPWVNPVVSPDGRSIAFVGFDWTPQTYKTDELLVIPRQGGVMRRISGDLDRDPEDLHWAPDGSGVYFAAEDRGSSQVLFAPLSGGGARPVTEGTHILSLDSLSPGGVAAGVRSTPGEPGDVVVYRLPRPRGLTRLTAVNDDVLSGIRLGDVAEILYTSTGGARVQGWLVKPPSFDAARKYPLILHIHGGPHAMYGVGFNYSFQSLAAAGYLVLYTNPRGSSGYGTAFGNAIDDAYPGVDYDDLMAGVDAVLARGLADPARLYVTGVSGGGVLSSWITAHTDRFSAAAVRAPVINWISFAGTTDITLWGYYRFRGHFWEDPSRWLQHSPLMHVGKVKTPTLLMTGELDLRTPMGQTEEYFQALKTRGVPTVLIRFNGEYHGTASKPSNFMRTQMYLTDWFGRYPADAGTKRAAGS